MLLCRYVLKPYNDWRTIRRYNVVNLNEGNLEVHNLLSLFHLLTRDTKGKEPLIDYSQSHFITSNTYLNIWRKKIIDKVVIKEIR
jgi:hypothetical protein